MATIPTPPTHAKHPLARLAARFRRFPANAPSPCHPDESLIPDPAHPGKVADMYCGALYNRRAA